MSLLELEREKIPNYVTKRTASEGQLKLTRRLYGRFHTCDQFWTTQYYYQWHQVRYPLGILSAYLPRDIVRISAMAL